MLVGLLYIHVLLKEITRYAYFILNAADDLGLMTISYPNVRDSIETLRFV